MAPAVVLVTGGSGLVGEGLRWVVENEPVGSKFGKRDKDEKWIFLRSKDGDLTDPAQTKAIFEKHRPTHVIHLAAMVGGVFANSAHPLKFLRENVRINDNVLECAKDLQVQRMVSCLSTCIFPDKVTYPLDESKIHLGPPHHSNYGYAHAKRLVDTYNHAYHDEYGCNFTAAIPTNVFGPHDNYDLESAHVLPALMHKCYLAKKNKAPFVVAGSGKPLRQFIYSRDLGKMFVWMLWDYPEIDPLILSVGEKDEVSIKHVADAIVKEMSFDGDYQMDSTKQDGQFKKTASNDKILKYIPDFPFTPFDQALKESIDWFVSNYDGARTGK